FESRLVAGAQPAIGMQQRRQRAPDGPRRMRERVDAGGADEIEDIELDGHLAQPAADLVGGVRDAQVEPRIAESAALGVQAERLVGLVELLQHFGADRVEPELDALVCALVAKGREIYAKVG